jgi:hypothetical protein
MAIAPNNLKRESAERRDRRVHVGGAAGRRNLNCTTLRWIAVIWVAFIGNAQAGQIDYLLQFSSESAARNSALMQPYLLDSGAWDLTQAVPGISVQIKSGGPLDSNWYILLSKPEMHAELFNSGNCVLVMDRDTAATGGNWIYKGVWSDAQISSIVIAGAFGSSATAQPARISGYAPPPLPAPPAPPQAVAAGFATPMANESFSNFRLLADGLTYAGDNGLTWSNGMGFSPAAPSALITWNGPGLVTLTSTASTAGLLNTHARSYGGVNSPLTTSFRFGYFEVSARIINSPAGQNWFSFWLFSSHHQQIFVDPDEWSEIDIVETGFYPGYTAVLHDWHFNGGKFSEHPGQNPRPSAWNRTVLPNADLTQWHTYGALWVAGRVDYYFDNVLVQSSVSNPINDTDPCSLILSVNGDGLSAAQFRWVHVYH